MLGPFSPYAIRDLGLIEYAKAYAIQKDSVDKVSHGQSPEILLCEHPPVITLGRLAKKTHLLVSKEQLKQKGIDLFCVDRGGDITLHCPGQLVVYPILDLTLHGKDLHKFMHKLEQVAIDLLKDFGIVAERNHGKTGVWAGDKKIASIGIGVRKWISFHGFSVNINPDLHLFSLIKPCGLDAEMTSMAYIQKKSFDMNLVKEEIVHHFCHHFDIAFKESYA